MNETTEYLELFLKNLLSVTVGRKREEFSEIPVNAIREIVVNAFGHAMYVSKPEIEINIHPGKITVFNPGTFPDGLTPADYIDKNISSFFGIKG